MNDILIGEKIIKDGVVTFVTEKEIWILYEQRDKSEFNANGKNSNPEPLTKSKVCYDCDYAVFANSECSWFCNLTKSLTKGYCEVAD